MSKVDRAADAPLLEMSPEHANLFSRAEDGIQRRDWKFAIDSLQRIIDDPTGSLTARADQPNSDSVVYEPVRLRATRMLTQLPPEGLYAYRLLYDGKAGRLFARAVDAHDPMGLREVIDRYMLTRWGDDAADLLASWVLDDGDASAAINWLEMIRRYVPDSDVPPDRIVLRFAVAYALTGRTDRAESLLAGWRAQPRQSDQSDALWTRDMGLGALLRPTPMARVAQGVDWPAMGGTPNRGVLMPAVVPTFVSPLAWRYDDSDVSSMMWSEVSVADDEDFFPPMPCRTAVVGNRLFLRTSRGCVALDADDLSVLWRVGGSDESDESSDAAASVSARRALDPFDEIGAAISVVGDVVFTIERPRNATTGRRLRRGRRRPASNRRVFGGDRSCRLVARDVASGEVLWRRGRTFKVDDPIGDVEFRSVPVRVGDAVWTVLLRGTELSVAMLRVDDGSLRRLVHLCSVDHPSQSFKQALAPAVAGGTVYVPAPQGMLFALDAVSGALRWAVQCGMNSAGEPTVSAGSASSTPIVVGGLVLFLPLNESRLYAVDAQNGRVRWSAPIAPGAYVVAADLRHVWLGGSSVTCLSIRDSAEVWVNKLNDPPTGRAVLAGGRILIPTLAGLATVDAETGADYRLESPGHEDGLLGSLLSLRSSLYSYDSHGIKRYPDLAAAYESVSTRHQRRPDDWRLTTQLAWLEHWRGRSRRAIDLLDGIDLADSAERPDKLTAVARLRVEAVLTSASARDVDLATALTLAREAGRMARSARDRVRAELTIADLLTRLGKASVAWHNLWTLGFEVGEGVTMPMVDRVALPLRSKIAQRLRTIEAAMSPREMEELRMHARRVITENTGVFEAEGGDVAAASERLRAVAQLGGGTDVQSASVMALARRSFGQGRYERAEQLFKEAGRFDQSSSRAIVPLMHLCRTYLASGVAASRLASACLDDLTSRFGAIPLPAEAPSLIGDSIASPTDVATVAEWAARQRAGAGQSANAAFSGDEPHAADSVSIVPQVLTGETVWSLEWDKDSTKEVFRLSNIGSGRTSWKPRIVRIRGQLPRELPDSVLLIDATDVLYSFAANDGRLLWRTALRPLEVFDDRYDVPVKEIVEHARSAVVDGQTAIINGVDALFAIGLESGKRLWAASYGPVADGKALADRERYLAVGDGFVTAMLRPGRLSLLRLSDGAVVWERFVGFRSIDAMWIVGGSVVTADAQRRHATLHDLRDGHVIKELNFGQPVPEARPIELVFSGNLLIGPDRIEGKDGMVAHDVTTGCRVWDVTFEKPLAQILAPSGDYVAATLLGGDVRLIKAQTGEPSFEWRVPGATTVIDAALVGPVLVVQYIADGGESQYVAMAAVDLATRHMEWQHENMTMLGRLSDWHSESTSFPPVYFWEGDETQQRNYPVRLATIDAVTGHVTGPKTPTNVMSGRPSLGEVLVTRDAIIRVTDKALIAYGRVPLSEIQEETDPSGTGSEADEQPEELDEP